MEDIASRAGAVGGGAENAFPQRQLARKGFLVRRHDADVLFQEDWVCFGDVEAAGVVDEDDMLGRFAKEVGDLGQRWDGSGGFFELGFPLADGDWLVVFAKEDFVAAGEQDEGEVDWGGLVLGNAACEVGELGEEAFSYSTTA